MYTQASLTAFAVEYQWMNERTNEYQLQTVHKAKVQKLHQVFSWFSKLQKKEKKARTDLSVFLKRDSLIKELKTSGSLIKKLKTWCSLIKEIQF